MRTMPVRSILPVLLALLTTIPALAAEPAVDWVPAPQRPSLNGESGKTWFSPEFGSRSGTFEAIYDSMADERKSVSGDFVTATFRYTYDAPIGEAGNALYPLHDESITQVLLDCDQHFSGTTSIRFLLDGNEAGLQHNDDDVLMMQTSSDDGTTIGDLCTFARERGAK